MNFLALAAAAIAAPASSTPAAPTVVIRYEDLDLTSAAGQRALKGRLAKAERTICQPRTPTGSIMFASDPDCIKALRRQTNAKVEAALHAKGRQSGARVAESTLLAGAVAAPK